MQLSESTSKTIGLSIPPFSQFAKLAGVGDCKILRLHLFWEVRLPVNESPRYEIKQSDGEAPVMLELWGNFIAISSRSSLKPKR